MSLIEKVESWLGWCPKHKPMKGDLFSQGVVRVEESDGSKGRGMVIYKPRFNYRALYPLAVGAVMFLAGMSYFLSAGIMIMAYFLGLIIVLSVFMFVFDFLSMPTVMEEGVAVGLIKKETYEWREIWDIEVKRDLIFSLRWVFHAPKLILHVERGNKIKEIAISAYNIFDLDEFHKVMVGEWRKHGGDER